ncbi:MAG: acyl carrier protein [Alphaproteobacteria bacterium]|nr:acyl carrier protein [Alphaproteobacteria bacterium]
MTLDAFVQGFAELFDETDPSEIQATTIFHDLDEWSSLTGMAVLAYVKSISGRTISPGELRKCVTVEDVYMLSMSK